MNHNDAMAPRVRLLTAVACTALAVAGCSAATTGENKAEPPAATGTSVTAATDAPVSEEQRQQAQQLAEDAETIMLDPALAPKDKYPKALGMFREALAIDPDNALAKKNVKLIEDIYASMGRPVPQPA